MDRQPSVTSLRLHLPNEQHIIVDSSHARSKKHKQRRLSRTSSFTSGDLMTLTSTILPISTTTTSTLSKKRRHVRQDNTSRIHSTISLPRVRPKIMLRVYPQCLLIRAMFFIFVCFCTINPLDHSRRCAHMQTTSTKRTRTLHVLWV